MSASTFSLSKNGYELSGLIVKNGLENTLFSEILSAYFEKIFPCIRQRSGSLFMRMATRMFSLGRLGKSRG